MGDAKKDDLRVRFDSRLKLKFCGSKVTSEEGPVGAGANWTKCSVLRKWEQKC